MFFYFLRAHSGPCNRKKRKKQAFLNIKNGGIDETRFYKKILFRNLNSFLLMCKVEILHIRYSRSSSKTSFDFFIKVWSG